MLYYSPSTGLFVWCVRTSNRVRVGEIAGTVRKDGRRVIKIDGRLYLANRLAWLYVKGVWPQGVIDHRDTNPSNDRIRNLRDVAHAVNIQNRAGATSANLSTGVLGVCKRGPEKFSAQIVVLGKYHHLGTFSTLDAAVKARKEGKRVHHG